MIKQYTLPGTTGTNDCWKTFNCLQFEGYNHLNDSYKFIAPDTGATHSTLSVCGEKCVVTVPRYGHTKYDFDGHFLFNIWPEFIFKRQHSIYKKSLQYTFQAIKLITLKYRVKYV